VNILKRVFGLFGLFAFGAISLSIASAGDEDEPLVVVQNGEYGFIDHHGNFVIQPHFIWADDWRGLGTVYVCGQYLSINSAGNLLPLRVAAEHHFLFPLRSSGSAGEVRRSAYQP
jgi:hypothetical protein